MAASVQGRFEGVCARQSAASCRDCSSRTAGEHQQAGRLACFICYYMAGDEQEKHKQLSRLQLEAGWKDARLCMYTLCTLGAIHVSSLSDLEAIVLKRAAATKLVYLFLAAMQVLSAV